MAELPKQAGGYLFHPIYGKSKFMWNADMYHRFPADPEKPADLERSLGVLVRFPDDWKDRPWTPDEIEAWKRKQEPQVKAETQEQTSAPAPKPGLPRGRPRGRPFKKKEPQAQAAE